jgi:fibronectin type 3 domain-containing protein
MGRNLWIAKYDGMRAHFIVKKGSRTPVTKRWLALLTLPLFCSSAYAKNHSVVLNWAASDGATAYNVYRIDGSCPAHFYTGAGSKLTHSPISKTTFTDTKVKADASYCYYVTSLRRRVESTPSMTKSVTVK